MGLDHTINRMKTRAKIIKSPVQKQTVIMLISVEAPASMIKIIIAMVVGRD